MNVDTHTHEMLFSGIKPEPRSWVRWITPVFPILLKAEAGGLKTILNYRSPCLKTQKQAYSNKEQKKQKSTPWKYCHLVTQLPCNPEASPPSLMFPIKAKIK